MLKLTINRPSNDNDEPLKIANNSQNWILMSMESAIAGDGCLQRNKTLQSSTVWYNGLWHEKSVWH